jgi:hypothetical protein
MFLFCLLGGGGFENFTCRKRGATKKYCNCSSSVSPCTINNEQSLSHAAYSQYSRIPNTAAYIAHSMLNCIIHYTTLHSNYFSAQLLVNSAQSALRAVVVPSSAAANKLSAYAVVSKQTKRIAAQL